MKYFQINQEELNYLKNQDPIFAEAIQHIGPIKRRVNPDLFSALIETIISQQISNESAKTVSRRLKELVGKLAPKTLVEATIDDIQQCGMSFRKAGTIQHISELFATKVFDVEQLINLDDESFINEITKIKGVGSWTAEMLLIHSLQRKDIISYKDLAVRRGMNRIYGFDDVTIEEFNVLRKRYSPYATIASLYLWELSK